MVRPNEAVIINMLEKGMATPKQIAEKLGRGYTELKAQSMVLTLARKGLIDHTKAAIILRGTPMIKFLKEELGSGLAKPVPTPVRR
jgi:predicted transcriptional regulator